MPGFILDPYLFTSWVGPGAAALPQPKPSLVTAGGGR